MFVYTKGSPESVIACCRPESVPSTGEFDKLCDEYARKGGRLLAFAWKQIHCSGIDADAAEQYPVEMAQSIERNAAESDLNFSGIAVLENRLKPTTPDVIRQLTE